jgi:RNA ligase (TIGR02306 family)
LRGIFSEGLIYPIRSHWKLGDNVAEELGIIKYEQPIPISLSGEVFSSQYTFAFDIENYKKYPHVLVDGEEVVFTEKLHGSFVVAMKVGDKSFSEAVEQRFLVGSKGLVAKGLYLKDNEPNRANSYLYVFKKYNLGEKLDKIGSGKIAIVGEVLGVQDLKYDAAKDQTFRAFGIQVDDKWVDHEDFLNVCQSLNIPHVPILYKGPFSSKVLQEHTSGKTTVAGATHIREGTKICE